MYEEKTGENMYPPVLCVHRFLHLNVYRVLYIWPLVPTLPTMLMSLEAVYHFTCSSFWSHRDVSYYFYTCSSVTAVLVASTEQPTACVSFRKAAPTCWKETPERPEPTWPNTATRRSSAPTWWRPTRTSSKTVWLIRWLISSWKTVSVCSGQNTEQCRKMKVFQNVFWPAFLCSPSTVLMCGMAGFSDFYKADWLQQILRRQDEEVGCFGRDSECLNSTIIIINNSLNYHLSVVWLHQPVIL